MNEGDIVIIKVAHEPYYCVGDRAILIGQDLLGDWWADFSINEIYHPPGVWCLTPGISEFSLLT